MTTINSSNLKDICICGQGVDPAIFEKAVNCAQMKTWADKQNPDFKYQQVRIDAVTMFGPNPGLIHITTDVTFNGVTANRVVFIRGGAVSVLLMLQSSETKKDYVVFVRQPRNGVGVRDLSELIAGMLDGATGTLKANGVAVKEIKEETHMNILATDLKLLGTGLPSAGGCDEWIDMYAVYLEASESYIQDLVGRKTGELGSDEQITVCIAEYDEFKTMLLDGRCQDFKAMSSVMMYETKLARKQLVHEPSRVLTAEEDHWVGMPPLIDQDTLAAGGGGGAGAADMDFSDLPEMVSLTAPPKPSGLMRQASCLAPMASSLAPMASSLAPMASSLAPQASSLAPMASSLAPMASSLAPMASSLAPQASGHYSYFS